MAATTDVERRIDRALCVLLGELEDQPDIAERWETWTELERVDYSLMWDHLMASYLLELDELYWSGEMTAEQQAGYSRLLSALKQAYPIIERLNLYRPPVVLEI